MSDDEIEKQNRIEVKHFLDSLPPITVEPDNEVEASAFRAITRAREFSLSNSISEHGRRLKRNLMIWSSVAVIVTYFEISLSQIPWLQIAVPEEGAAITPLIAFAPLVYTLISFYVQAMADLRRWRLYADSEFFRAGFNVLHRLNAFLNEMIQISKGLSPTILAFQNLQQRLKVVGMAAEMAGHKFKETVALAARYQRVTAFQAYFWELSVPLAVAVLATIYSAPAAWAALVSIVRQAGW